MKMQPGQFEYVGFWARLGALLIDGVLLTAPLVLINLALDETLHWSDPIQPLDPAIFPLCAPFLVVAPILFWVTKQATPGKMVISAKIVDAETGDTPSIGQFIRRYLACTMSSMPFFLGFICIAFDGRKQGWHDALAGTVVVWNPRKSRKPRREELQGEELQRKLRRDKLRREDS